MRALVRLSCAAVVALAWSTPRPAASQPPAEVAPAPSALDLAREGAALYEAGRWAEAEAKFTAAEALAHSPVFLLYIGRARRSAARLLAARETFRQVAAEPLPEGAPPPWRQAQTDARAELAALEPMIPTIIVRAAPGSRATLDGATVELDRPIDVDPGTRRVVVTTGSGERAREIEVRLGERERELTFDEAAAAPAREPAGAPGTARDATPRGGSLVPGAIVLGVGVVGLGVGAVTGLVALGKSDDVRALCGEGPCDISRRSDVEAARSDAGTFADVSTVSFIAGGVLATAGVVLLVVRPFGEDAPSQVSAGPRGVTWASTF